MSSRRQSQPAGRRHFLPLAFFAIWMTRIAGIFSIWSTISREIALTPCKIGCGRRGHDAATAAPGR